MIVSLVMSLERNVYQVIRSNGARYCLRVVECFVRLGGFFLEDGL
jgi:hypothetical protein